MGWLNMIIRKCKYLNYREMQIFRPIYMPENRGNTIKIFLFFRLARLKSWLTNMKFIFLCTGHKNKHSTKELIGPLISPLTFHRSNKHSFERFLRDLFVPRWKVLRN